MYAIYSLDQDEFIYDKHGFHELETYNEVHLAIKSYLENMYYGEDLMDITHNFIIYELQEIKRVHGTFALKFELEEETE